MAAKVFCSEFTLLFCLAEYAKLAMGPLWAEMKDTWEMFLDADGDAYPPPITSNEMVPPRLAVYSGHDTTIMPLLASISPDLWNDTEWAPYASMVLIEVRMPMQTTDSYHCG
jgi:hypothetical protein